MVVELFVVLPVEFGGFDSRITRWLYRVGIECQQLHYEVIPVSDNDLLTESAAHDTGEPCSCSQFENDLILKHLRVVEHIHG